MHTPKLLVLALSALAAPTLHADFDPERLALELAALGPRYRGSIGYVAAQDLLQAEMLGTGLGTPERIEAPGSGGWTHLSTTRAGRDEGWVALTAHYDTTETNDGLLDNASGCAVVLATAAEIADAPLLRHGLHLMLTDAEESGARGTREWLARSPSDPQHTYLAQIAVDSVGDRASGSGVVHLVHGSSGAGLRLTPGWLVQAVLDASQAVELPLAVMDRRWSILSQLALRVATPTRISDATPFLEAGVPSLALSDLGVTGGRSEAAQSATTAEELVPQRLDAWAELTSTVIQRLDALPGRPVADTEYLVFGRRLLGRRQLLWVGFLLWMLLVWRGLPGRWRREAPVERRHRGRIYLPGFAFRMVFLVAMFVAPTLSTVLLYPAAVCALVGTTLPLEWRRVGCVLGVAPTVLLALWLTLAQAAGWYVLSAVGWLPAGLILLTLATFCSWQLDPAR